MTHKYSINIRGHLFDLDTPKIMGILNVTPDSFYSGSRVQHLDELLRKADRMLEEGVDLFDIGGYSSRPGSVDVPIEEEIERVVEPVQRIHDQFPEIPISVDTFRSAVAAAALEAGADLVNDISGGSLDNGMLPLIKKLRVPFVAMHMRGNPQTMTSHTDYQPDVVEVVLDRFAELDRWFRDEGLPDLILDPGFGFAKKVDQSFRLLHQLHELQAVGRPILVGLSRKSMIWKTLNQSADDALNGTTALHAVALLKGAHVLRVHDVREAKETSILINRLLDAGL